MMGGHRGVYVVKVATVVDSELVGLAAAWEEGDKVVALDSQGVIKRDLWLPTV